MRLTSRTAHGDPACAAAGRFGRCPHTAHGAAAQGRARCSAYFIDLPPGGAAVFRQADRATAELRGAGGHRDGERAAARRIARAHAAISKSCSNTRPRPATCFRSSAARPSICSRCSTRCSRLPPGCAAQISADLNLREGDAYSGSGNLLPLARVRRVHSRSVIASGPRDRGWTRRRSRVQVVQITD